MPGVRIVYTERDGVRITGSFAKIDGAHRIMFVADTPSGDLTRQYDEAVRSILASCVSAGGHLDAYEALRLGTPYVAQRYGKFVCRVAYDTMALGMFPPTVFDIKAGTRVKSMTLRADEVVRLPSGVLQPSWTLTDIVLSRDADDGPA